MDNWHFKMLMEDVPSARQRLNDSMIQQLGLSQSLTVRFVRVQLDTGNGSAGDIIAR
jgi:hypothetical protein